MTMPNFLIIGAPRSGTTSLYEGLRRHPDVFMPSWKEPGFFEHYYGPVEHAGPGDEKEIRRGVTDPAQYRALFDEVQAERMVGEASTIYLSLPAAARAIRESIPEAKLIAILRHPADRAYSHYQQHVQQQRDPAPSFEEAIADEPRRIAAGWGPFWNYVGTGFYGQHLSVYYDHFPREQIHVALYDDLQAGLPHLMSTLYGFLGVESGFQPDLPENLNASGVPKRHMVHSFLSGPHPIKRLLKPLVPYRARIAYRNFQSEARNRNLQVPDPIKPETRNQLIDTFAEDIHLVERLIGRDLSHWLKKDEQNS